jgi:uncharacterized protein (DUF362 family)
MSRVVVVKYNGGDSSLGEEEYRQLLSSGLGALTGEPTPKTAIQSLLHLGAVGMKLSCITRKQNSTPVSLVDALSKLLVDAGFHDNDIILWERSNRELSAAGYTLNASSFGRRCLGTDTNGVGYGREFYEYGEVNSLVSRVMTEMVSSNINMPILKDHSIAGLSAGMKNMYGAINNPNKYHPNGCDPYCAHVSNLEPIRTKNKLVIMDAMNVQYHGGPGFVPQFIHRYGALIFAVDPVAGDRVGLEILERIRALKNVKTLEQDGRGVKYLASAEKTGLGIADLKRIELKVIQIDRSGNESAGELF